jgi:phosphoribosylformylglycinamidine synthase PurS subunit
MAHVRVYVRLKPALLDTAGRAVENALHNLGWRDAADVRIGKLIEFDLPGGDEQTVREMCDKLLANPVIEDYSIETVAS